MTEPETKTPSAQSGPAPAAAQPSPAAPIPVEAAPAPAEEALAAAKKEALANYDRYLRAVADLENFRKRTAREKQEQQQFGALHLMQGLLPVIDNLNLGLAAARQQADAKTIADGVTMVLGQFKDVLERHGLKEVNPAGQKFDPHLHESISHLPSAEVPEEHVLQVVRTGYTLNGRLVRAASVVLSSGPAKEPAK